MVSQSAVAADLQHYLDRVESLYADVRLWIAAMEPDVQFAEGEMDLSEELTGAYKAPTLEVSRTGRPALRFVPRGAYMLNAEGQVDVKSPLGREMLVWVSEGGPAIAFQTTVEGRVTEVVRGRPLFPNVREGWAWVDENRRALIHLDCDVFRYHILASIGE